MSLTPVGALVGRSAVTVLPASVATLPAGKDPEQRRLREVFDQAMGQTLFGQMLKSMRRTVGKPAYFHGGRAEEIFQQQLDQVLAEKLSRASGPALTDPMFELFTLQRS